MVKRVVTVMIDLANKMHTPWLISTMATSGDHPQSWHCDDESLINLGESTRDQLSGSFFSSFTLFFFVLRKVCNEKISLWTFFAQLLEL